MKNIKKHLVSLPACFSVCKVVCMVYFKADSLASIEFDKGMRGDFKSYHSKDYIFTKLT